jgi:hypothetical protein
MVVGRRQGRVPSSGVTSWALCEEGRVAHRLGAVVENKDSGPNGTYLQADLGCVQGVGEKVSKTGSSACAQALHSCCGRHF